MRYLLLIATEPAPPDPDGWERMLREYGAYTGWLQEQGLFVAAEALQDATTATTVSVASGSRVITDGPFAETKEVVGGYYLINAQDLDTAIEAAARCPGAAVGKVEIRPIAELG
ncbi:MAG TPA: YciI family protein [Candidatus Limnocylindrales bacterium]|nr:YciI family protein [Candidatus Limnocylindrales bacterium]